MRDPVSVLVSDRPFLMDTNVGAGFLTEMLLTRPLSAAERSKLFLYPFNGPSDRPLLVARYDTDCTLLGPLLTRLVDDRNREISVEYADRSGIGRDRSSSANTSYSLWRESSPGCPCRLANSADGNRPSSPALIIPDGVGTHWPLT